MNAGGDVAMRDTLFGRESSAVKRDTDSIALNPDRSSASTTHSLTRFQSTDLGGSVLKLIFFLKCVGIRVNPADKVTFIGLFYKGLMGIICCMALPYYYYVYVLTGKWENYSIFLYFMMGNLPPPLTWIFLQMHFSQNRYYQLLKEAVKSNEFMDNDHFWLIRFLKKSLALSAIIILSYVVWLALYVQTMPINWAIFFGVIGVTFVVRLMVPFLAITCLAIEIRLYEREITQFMASQFDTCSVKESAAAVERIDINVQQTAVHWRLVLTAVILIPTITFIIQVYDMVMDQGFVNRYWWFILYEYHYFISAWWVLYRIAHLTSLLQRMHHTLCLRIAKGELVYTSNSGSEQEVYAFLQYLTGKRGVKALGMLINGDFAMRFGYALAVVSFTIISNQVFT